MAAEQSGNINPLIPPTQADQLPPLAREITWPRTLGIVSVVFGIFGALAALAGVSVPLIVRALQMAVADKDAVNWDAVGQAVTWIARISLAMVPVAFLLLVVGIGLLRRRRWAVPAAKVWAVIKIAMIVLATAVNVMVQGKILAALQQAGTTMKGPGLSSSPGSIAWNIAWGCALPVFMLIWLSREEIREDIAAWR